MSCAKEARRALLAQTQAGAADVVQVAVHIVKIELITLLSFERQK